MQQPNSARVRENPFISIIFCVAIPSLILSKLSGAQNLGPKYALLLALAFPVGYGIYEFMRERRVSFFAGLGFVSTLLTGLFAYAELSPMWIAIKEMAIPLVIAIFILLSVRSKTPMVKQLLFNKQILNVDLIEARAGEKGLSADLEALLLRVSYIMAGSFFLSAALNYGLADYLLSSVVPGTPEFNEKLGYMTSISFVVISIPSISVMLFGMFYMIRGIRKLTGMETDQILNSPDQAK